MDSQIVQNEKPKLQTEANIRNETIGGVFPNVKNV